MLFFYENKGSNTIYADVREKLGCAAHLHGHLEIVFMKEGSVELNVEGKDYILRENEALIIFPNQLHSYKDIAKSRSTLLIFAPELLQPDYKNSLRDLYPKRPFVNKNTTLPNRIWRSFYGTTTLTRRKPKA